MARTFADALALFLLPFAVYGMLIFLRRGVPVPGGRWSRGRVSALSLAGLGTVLVGLLLLGFLAPRREGAYVPAHMQDGRLVPGVIR